MAEVGSITIDKRSFNRAMKRLGEKYNVTAEQVIFDQHRQHSQDWIKATPPFKKAEGIKAVDKDIDKLFIELDKQQVLDFYAENFGKKPKSTGKKVKKATRDLEAEGIIFNWNGDKNRMRGYHEKFRTGKQRGVRFRSRKIPVGNFEFGTGMYAKDTKIRAYKRERFKSVGKLKAGWVPAALKFGATIPAWVKRHTQQRGAWADRYNKKKATGFLASINSVPWAKNKLKGAESFIKRKREKALKQYFERQLQIAANKWSRSKNG